MTDSAGKVVFRMLRWLLGDRSHLQDSPRSVDDEKSCASVSSSLASESLLVIVSLRLTVYYSGIREKIIGS